MALPVAADMKMADVRPGRLRDRPSVFDPADDRRGFGPGFRILPPRSVPAPPGVVTKSLHRDIQRLMKPPGPLTRNALLV